MNHLLNMPADHSSWAKSVRWSCGRPSMWGMTVSFGDREDAYRMARASELAFLHVSASLSSPTGLGSIVVNVA